MAGIGVLDERDAFEREVIGHPTIDDFVLWYVNTIREETGTPAGDLFSAMADRLILSVDEFVASGYVLSHQWQREAVYQAYRDDIWETLDVQAQEVFEEDDDPHAPVTPLGGLVEMGWDMVIKDHERFVAVIVTVAFGIVAEDILSQWESGGS